MLRKLTEHDANQICDWIKTERDLLLWGGPYFDFPIDIDSWVPLIAEHVGEHPSRECWAVIDGSDRLIGSFQLSYNYRSGQIGLGRVIIEPSLRGLGYSGTLLKLACQQAFLKVEFHRLELRVFSFNETAILAYKKMGFVHEGAIRQSTRYGLEYWDTMIMGLLKADS